MISPKWIRSGACRRHMEKGYRRLVRSKRGVRDVDIYSSDRHGQDFQEVIGP